METLKLIQGQPLLIIVALFVLLTVNVMLMFFCENAGRQCVAMSLCSLIHVYCQGAISDSGTLVNIMNRGNELYSMLSRFLRQQYLLLSEILTMVSVDNSNYSVELSESYTDDLHLHHDIIENIAYMMPFDVALEELQNEHFNMFLLKLYIKAF